MGVENDKKKHFLPHFYHHFSTILPWKEIWKMYLRTKTQQKHDKLEALNDDDSNIQERCIDENFAVKRGALFGGELVNWWI